MRSVTSANSRRPSDSPPVLPHWQQLDVQSLTPILASREGLESLVQLQGEDAAAAVEILDKSLDSDLSPSQRKNCTLALRKLCGGCGILPTSCILIDGLEATSSFPLAGGGFADVWEGRYRSRVVAIKALKMYATDDPAQVKTRFCKEALIWKRLSHPNVLPFLGIATSPFPLCMVSIWMIHGNIVNYVKAHPEANRLLLLSDVVSGLNYLHSGDLVHGDLKGANVLINNDYRACIADFGLMVIIHDSTAVQLTSTSAGGGTLRWMAPELLMPEKYDLTKCKPTKKSDMYAVGMVVYEVMTGSVPFHRYGTIAVTQKVLAGERPDRPTDSKIAGLSDGLWQLVELCWHPQPTERPAVRVVLDHLYKTTRYWEPLLTTENSDLEAHHDSDASSSTSDFRFPVEQYGQTSINGNSAAVSKSHVSAGEPRIIADRSRAVSPIASEIQPPPQTTPAQSLERPGNQNNSPADILPDVHIGMSRDGIELIGSRASSSGMSAFSSPTLPPPRDAKHSSSLSQSGADHLKRFKRTRKLEDAEQAITCYREALDLRPLGDSGRWSSIHSLGRAIESRYEATQKLEDLTEAIEYFHKALDARPVQDPDRWFSVHNLGRAIEIRYKRSQKLEDLDEALTYYRATLDIRPHKDPSRWCSFHNLGRLMEGRAKRSGKLEDLEAAVAYFRKSFDIRPLDDPERRYSSQNLSRINNIHLSRTRNLQVEQS